MKRFEDYIDTEQLARSSIGEDKLYNLFKVIKKCATLNGCFAELGVYRGGTLKFLARIAKDLNKKCYGFDTFEGMPYQGEHDWHEVGHFIHEHGSVEEVMSFLRGYDNVHLFKGVFPKSANEYGDLFSFVHLDGDQYQSTKDGLEYFWPRMCPKGAIVLDDHDWGNCRGVAIAAQEFGKPVHKISTYQAVIYRD